MSIVPGSGVRGWARRALVGSRGGRAPHVQRSQGMGRASAQGVGPWLWFADCGWAQNRCFSGAAPRPINDLRRSLHAKSAQHHSANHEGKHRDARAGESITTFEFRLAAHAAPRRPRALRAIHTSGTPAPLPCSDSRTRVIFMRERRNFAGRAPTRLALSLRVVPPRTMRPKEGTASPSIPLQQHRLASREGRPRCSRVLLAVHFGRIRGPSPRRSPVVLTRLVRDTPRRATPCVNDDWSIAKHRPRACFLLNRLAVPKAAVLRRVGPG